MYISDNFPEKILENPNMQKFSGVLDQLQIFKAKNICDSLRIYNHAVLCDKNWILKRLRDYGVSFIPYETPIGIMIQFLLNVNNILATRGSIEGVKLLCGVLSLGNSTIDDSAMYNPSSLLLLNSNIEGAIIGDSQDTEFYILNNSEDIFKATTLTIAVDSPYFNSMYSGYSSDIEAVIKRTIESVIPKWIMFSPKITITYSYSGTLVAPRYHNFLNQNFV